MTVVELKKFAKDIGIKGFSKLKKAELIIAIKKASRKSSRKGSRKASRKGSRRGSRRPSKYSKFIKEHVRLGMTMKQIASFWGALKYLANDSARKRSYKLPSNISSKNRSSKYIKFMQKYMKQGLTMKQADAFRNAIVLLELSDEPPFNLTNYKLKYGL
jgi:hypothetical protein